jgi:hypothetical protein
MGRRDGSRRSSRRKAMTAMTLMRQGIGRGSTNRRRVAVAATIAGATALGLLSRSLLLRRGRGDGRARITPPRPRIGRGLKSLTINRPLAETEAAWRELRRDLEPGLVRFERAPGDRGAVARVDMGRARDEVWEDLRAFKQVCETGEIATAKGPRGTCK